MNKVVSVMLILFFINGLFITVFSSVSASDLIEGSWNVKAPMQQARLVFGVVVVDGKIYAIGGVSDGVGIMGTNEWYDPVTDIWVTLTSMPTPRAGFAIVEYQNKIYCIGGYAADKVLLDVNEVYDIVSDSWRTKTPLPVNESYIQAHVVDGKIYVITQQVLYAYDPIEDFWTSKTSIPTHGIHGYSAVVDNKIIIIDQVAQASYLDYSEVRFIATMKIMIYDPKIDVWSEGQTSPEYHSLEVNMMMPLVAGATTGAYAPKKIYILLSASIYVYDPVEGTWTTDTGPSTYVLGYGVAVVDDILYIFGGMHHPHVENIQYVPIGHKNAVPTPEPSNSPTSHVTSEPTNPTATSEPPDVPEPTLTYIIVAVLAVIIVTFAMGSFFYFKKEKRFFSDKLTYMTNI